MEDLQGNMGVGEPLKGLQLGGTVVKGALRRGGACAGGLEKGAFGNQIQVTSRGRGEVPMELEREKPAWEARKISAHLVAAWICGQEVEESRVL